MEPIIAWNELINAKASEQEMQVLLEKIYHLNKPHMAAIIMNSHCSSSCRHCIYASDYEKYNNNMSWQRWIEAFQIIYEKMGITKFILEGRGINENIIKAIRYIKENLSNAQVGVIADGESIEPFVDSLIDCPPDWLDVSADGLEENHDDQRDRKGAFKKTVAILDRLKESQVFDKINILTCLTKVNIQSITEMIRYFNNQGFKNFFISPMSILDGYRPDQNLRPDQDEFMVWLDDLMTTAARLTDSWVELNLFDVFYAKAIKKTNCTLFNEFGFDHDHLTINMYYQDNDFNINYYPSSLTGIRELIVNTNGDVIPPKVMAMGHIPTNLVIGNILQIDGCNLYNSTGGKNYMKMFLGEFIEERDLLSC